MARKKSPGYTGKQTGTPSSFGQTRSGGNTMNPWGKNVPKQTPITKSKVRGSSRQRATPDPQLKGMDYPPNDPRYWPAINTNGTPTKKPTSPTAPSPATVARNNTIVNNAFKRGGYAG